MSKQRLIDANALIEKHGDWYTEEGTEEGYIGTIKGIVNRMPTIEERRPGTWIELTNTNHTYVCSVCGRMLVNITDGKNKVVEHYPYCHCGARMVQEGEEHDSERMV